MGSRLIDSMVQSMGQSSVPYGLLDPETFAFVFSNQALVSVLASHRLMSGSVPEGLLSDLRPALLACLEQNAESTYEWSSTGTRLSLVPLRDGERTVAIQCFVSQQDSAALSRRIEQTLDCLPVGIWLAKPNGEIYWVNKANPGHSESAKVGDAFDTSAWVDKVHPEDLVICASSFSRAAMKGKVDPFEFRMRAKDGTYHWFFCDGSPVVNDDGSVDHWAGIALDISDRKVEQEAQRQEVTRLTDAARAEAVQLEKTSKELVRVQKMELLGHLAGSVAHDFNNLLFVIRLNADQILRSTTDAKLKEHAHQIQRDVARARRTASELMTFSGGQPRSPRTYQVKALLADIEELLRRAVGAEVQLQIELDDDLAAVCVDKTYFENSLINLAVNARDAVEGNGLVQMFFRNRLIQRADGEYAFVQIEVKDNGMGMSEHTRERIFEPFFTTKEPGKGTGLGLPMVASFAEQCGGFVEVLSELGKGTSVLLHLPKALHEVEPEVEETFKAIGGTENLLLVEDDLHVRNALAEALMGLGYVVSTAHSPEVALRYIRNGLKLDLIISDIRMPGQITALEMVHLLEAENYQLPVLFMTGYAPDIGIEEGMVEGRYPIVYKPISIDEMVVKVRETLSNRA